jgi:Cof subfamily protein (haloacid dehalogenase superfamily)
VSFVPMPQSPIRLLALDVDGTLLNGARQITPATQRALECVAERGVKIVLASARSPRSLLPILRTIVGEGYLVAYGGGLISHVQSDGAHCLAEKRLALASAQTMVRRALLRNISVGWFVGDDWFISEWNPLLRQEAGLVDMQPHLEPELDVFDQAPHKLQCMVDSVEGMYRLQVLRAELPEDCIGQFSHRTYLEIVPRGVDKAQGLRELGAYLGIGLNEMAALGDGENDLEMLREVGCGIAMGNASRLVRRAARWVTETNERDGVAVAVERMLREGLIG